MYTFCSVVTRTSITLLDFLLKSAAKVHKIIGLAKYFFANPKNLRTFAVGNNPKDSIAKTANNGNLSNIATAKDMDKFT